MKLDIDSTPFGQWAIHSPIERDFAIACVFVVFVLIGLFWGASRDRKRKPKKKKSNNKLV